jgi:hypothetical protein
MLKWPESFLSLHSLFAGLNLYGASEKHQVAAAPPSILDFIIQAG